MNQQRLCRVQLVNWGTFDGAQAFQVPRRGLLLTGPSGAGKSSVLDAMAAILVRPARLKFNAAAQGTETGDRERSLITYVLGAYKRETDTETGEVGTAFLRKGPTWSGVALTFDNGRGDATTLIRLFHLRGGTTSGADLKSMYVLAPESVDLLSLQAYAKDGIENRRVGQAFPRWDVFGADAYTGFANKFRRRLGLGSEQAQLLLHKTQSAKNLTNLDSLFRDFMLDKPDTFALADETVAQFGELSVAHAAVVDARRQVEALAPLRDQGQRHADATAALGRLAEEEANLGTWLSARELGDAEASLARQRPLLSRLEGELAEAENRCATLEAERVEAQRALDGSAGAQLSTLDELIATLDRELGTRRTRVDELAETAASLGLDWPQTASGAGEFEQRVADLAAEFEVEQGVHRTKRYDAFDARRIATERRDAIVADLQALRAHGSNLDPQLLATRQFLAQQLQVATSTLPFVGELVQVQAVESAWAGAIERVLGSFARTLVVPEAHYLAASEVIDAHHLGTRLVYERVAADTDVVGGSEPARDSLVSKVELAQGPHRDWLADRLRRRFDYVCVASAREFGRHPKAVTRSGQVKHSDTRHEKDDRRRVDDRAKWVLGFSTQAKEAELERQQVIAEVALAEAAARVDELDHGDSEHQRRRNALAALERINWTELDMAGLAQQLQANVSKRDELRRDHSDVPALEAARDKAVATARAAEEVRRGLVTKRDRVTDVVLGLQTRIEQLQVELAAAPPMPEGIKEQLDAQASTLDVRPERLEGAMQHQLSKRRSEAEERRSDAAKLMVRQMARYVREWPAQASDWAEEVEYLPEFLARLDTLEHDGLPAFEKRFFDLLQNQARTNIGQLSTQIRGARREIRTRVDEVNKSLRLTEFSPGGHLQIEVKNRALPEVEQFLADLNAITSGSLADVFASDSPEDRASAEQRFALMKGVLDRLGSADPAHGAWRDKCLDTRQHVQFQARVLDATGTQLDVFTGSGGRSGGERQKLVTFCLAAALRFQLAPAGQSAPSYALVVIDEAFDKADHTFTQAGLEVFTTFGFQLLLATPMKMLQTIEDYVGGVVMVTNDSGRRSQVHELPFEIDDPIDAPIDEPDEVQQQALL